MELPRGGGGRFGFRTWKPPNLLAPSSRFCRRDHQLILHLLQRPIERFYLLVSYLAATSRPLEDITYWNLVPSVLWRESASEGSDIFSAMRAGAWREGHPTSVGEMLVMDIGGILFSSSHDFAEPSRIVLVRPFFYFFASTELGKTSSHYSVRRSCRGATRSPAAGCAVHPSLSLQT